MEENYQLKWHSHGTYLHTTLASLQKSRSFTDVTLCTVEGLGMSAHRFILSACSKYFDKVLQQTYVAPPIYPLVIILPAEISYKTLGVLLQYMYCGEATITTDQLNNVLKAGDLLQIRGLHQEVKDGIQNIKVGVITQQLETSKEFQFQKQSNGDTEQDKKNMERPKEGITLYSANGSPAKMEFVNGISKNYDTTVISHTQMANVNLKSASDEELPKCLQDGPETQISVKEEPIEWQDCDNSDYEAHMLAIQPEVSYASTDEQDDTDSQFYAPLVCDICQETFTSPSLWVRHAKTHENLTSTRTNKRIKTEENDCNSPPEFKLLRCELCQEIYPTPSEWVKHIEETHTNEQLAMANILLSQEEHTNSHPIDATSSALSSSTSKRKPGKNRLVCTLCNKTFPSQASIMIHIRSHTGEKPYTCTVCEKGFNVKSNLLRHMRTLHDSVITPEIIAKLSNKEGQS